LSDCACLQKRTPHTPSLLKEVEEIHMVIELYVWLALRFEDLFPDIGLAELRLEESHSECPVVSTWLSSLLTEKRSRVRKIVDCIMLI
jgi:hypothetical protein